MEDEIKMYLDEAQEMMKKAVSHTQSELAKIRAGKAMPSMLDGILVEYYGVNMPINQIATINTPDARTLTIRPFEKGSISAIEKAIKDSDLGINPQNNGEMIILNIPPLTEERRKQLVKQVKQEIENGKISVRNARKEINEALRKLQKEGAAEDAIKKAEDSVQKYTDSYIHKLDEIMTTKEAEIMKV
ncbi:ribosome recycling factor [Raineya orbicola]|uniref:Ribosome-recycling factor n=1 Tax=Raineya orbicola TaxID=2016530 RepID=A0A2N3IJL2_9BACT|nr:ribosome recycling factor [Raineya orbicola]PKQ70504.1 frr: ribosome recycling factor [Raineya orbicola]